MLLVEALLRGVERVDGGGGGLRCRSYVEVVVGGW